MTPMEETLTVVLAMRRNIACDTVEFTFAAPDGAALPPWDPGAHIDVTAPNGQVRQYSLCGSVGDTSRLCIAVLREPDGRGGSLSLIDDLGVGEPVTISAPRNHFTLLPAPQY